MPKVSDISAVTITLDVDHDHALFILLGADGSINRLGTGSISNMENVLCIGITKEPLFDRLMTHLDDEMLDHMGEYDVPEKRGALCQLLITLVFRDGKENGFGFRYGSDSEGPPHEIRSFVVAAKDLTEPWYQEQKKISGKKKHGCLWFYILYIILYIVYFLFIGMILKIFFPNLQSETALAVYLAGSALLSILTVLIINNRDSVRKVLHL